MEREISPNEGSSWRRPPMGRTVFCSAIVLVAMIGYEFDASSLLRPTPLRKDATTMKTEIVSSSRDRLASIFDGSVTVQRLSDEELCQCPPGRKPSEAFAENWPNGVGVGAWLNPPTVFAQCGITACQGGGFYESGCTSKDFGCCCGNTTCITEPAGSENDAHWQPKHQYNFWTRAGSFVYILRVRGAVVQSEAPGGVQSRFRPGRGPAEVERWVPNLMAAEHSQYRQGRQRHCIQARWYSGG